MASVLNDGHYDVPNGKIATIVTHLEMRTRPVTPAATEPVGWTLARVSSPQVDWYRSLFKSVGSDWLWFGRLRMADAKLQSIITDPEVHIYTLRQGDRDGALMELDFRTRGACELAYFGVIPELIGTGAGRYLMNAAIEKVWQRDIEVFHVHTCTLDSPQALRFYQRSGFTAVRQQVEIANDPRCLGELALTDGPNVPVFTV